MTLIKHHGFRVYRPLSHKSILDFEVQFFRYQWGSDQLHRQGNGKASLKAKINPRNLFVGIWWDPSDDGMQYFVVPFPTLTFRLHIRREWRTK